jgi:hypothetical protein
VEALTSPTQSQTGPAHQPSRAIGGEESIAAAVTVSVAVSATVFAHVVLAPDEGAVFFLQPLPIAVVVGARMGALAGAATNKARAVLKSADVLKMFYFICIGKK